MSATRAPGRAKPVCGWIGIACWLLIIPVKIARHVDPASNALITGLAPSFLGPLGLVLVILTRSGGSRGISLARAILVAGSLALLLEFAQALPLVRRIYTFDWLDVAVTLVALAAGAAWGAALRRTAGSEAKSG